MAVTRRTPRNQGAVAVGVEFLHCARTHALGRAQVRVLRRAAAVARAAGGLYFVTHGFKQRHRAAYDVAVAHHVAAVPEGYFFGHVITAANAPFPRRSFAFAKTR